jgi:hypothetical protein
MRNRLNLWFSFHCAINLPVDDRFFEAYARHFGSTPRWLWYVKIYSWYHRLWYHIQVLTVSEVNKNKIAESHHFKIFF